jgi:hypothetical protein
MNIRMAAAAACALALGIAPAKTDLLPLGLYTVEAAFTASPNVVQVGETTFLHLTATLVPDLAADAAAGVIVFGMAFPGPLFLTDGQHSLEQLFQLTPNIPSEYTFAVSYQIPGTYSPFVQGSGVASVEPIGGGAIQHQGFVVSGSTSVSVVSSPVVGTGLPGLVLAFGGVMTWCRRRRVTNS